MIVRANVFSTLQTVKSWLDHSLKTAVSKHPLSVNMLKGAKHLWNLNDGTFIRFFWLLFGKMTWKISPFLNFEILGVFLNALTADDQYPVPYSNAIVWKAKKKIL